MMHFRLAGKPIEISMEYQTQWVGGTQIPRPDWELVCWVWNNSERFSGPILYCEGGFYDMESHGFERQPGDCGYYTYAEPSKMEMTE
jgi:hypothetical protein